MSLNQIAVLRVSRNDIQNNIYVKLSNYSIHIFINHYIVNCYLQITVYCSTHLILQLRKWYVYQQIQAFDSRVENSLLLELQTSGIIYNGTRIMQGDIDNIADDLIGYFYIMSDLVI